VAGLTGRKQLMKNRLSRSALFIVMLIVLLAGVPAPGGRADTVPGREPIVVVRVYFADLAERDRLAAELGAAEVSTAGGYLTVWTVKSGYEALLARGLRVEEDVEATALANQPVQWSKPDTFYNGYRTVEELYTRYDELVAQYPGLVEKISIGPSWCAGHVGGCQLTSPTLVWDGYVLYVLHITNRAIAGPKPVYWYDADTHAREIVGPELAVRFAEWLLQGYETDADAHWLVDYHDIYVLPVLNPDGHHMVEYGDTNPYWVRKNSDYDDGCTYWGDGGSGLGTDLNRNFPFLWGCCGGSSGSACAETYRGPGAGSEPEVSALVTFVRTLIPDQRGPGNTDPAPITTTGVLQSMHSYGEMNLYSWGWTPALAPNDADLQNIGAHMSAPNAGGNGYVYHSSYDLYSVDGSTTDWGYGELGIPSFCTELEGGTFTPSFTEVNGIWNNNKGMLKYLAKIARTPYLLTRGPDANSVAASPVTVTQGVTLTINASINYAWTGNTYSQAVAAAELYVDVPPWAGGTPIAMTAVDGTFSSATEAVTGLVPTLSLATGRHIIFVRGRGVTDYQGYQSWGPVTATFVWVTPGVLTYHVYAPVAQLNAHP